MAKVALRWVLVTIAIVLGLAGVAVIALIFLSRTSAGMDLTRKFALNFLQQAVNGRIEVERISGGGLFRDITLHRVVITDSLDQPFAKLDSLSAQYDLVGMLLSRFGQIQLGPVHLYRPDVHLTQLPGDSVWNFDRIFRSGGGGDGRKRLVRFTDVNVMDGRATIVRPFTDDGGALAQRFVLEKWPGGTVQVLRFEGIDGAFPEITVMDPMRAAREIRVRRFSTQAHVFHQPMDVKQVAGTAVIEDAVISLDFEEFKLENGEGSVRGRLLRQEHGTGYDLTFAARRLVLEDVAWLDRRIPESGTAKFELQLRGDAGEDLMLSFRDVDVDAPGVRAAGRLAVTTGEPLTFRNVDLRVASLDLARLERLLERELPLDGSLRGTLRANGTLSRMRTNGEMRLATRGVTEPFLRWDGTVGLQNGVRFTSMHTQFETVDLALLDRLRPGMHLGGRVTGRADLEGRPEEGLQVRATVRHEENGFVSELDGGGTVTLQDAASLLALDFRVEPLRLETVARRVAQLDSLRGEARGRVAVHGPTDSLRITAALTTAAGPIELDATIDRHGDAPHVRADAVLHGFEPSLIGLAGIDARVSGRIRADVTGNGAEDLSGPIEFHVDSARILGFPFERSRGYIRLASGVAAVDSAFFRAPGLRGSAQGGIGIVAGRSDTLAVTLASESLEPLEPIVFGEVRDPTTPRIDGAGTASLRLSGALGDLAMEGRAGLRHARVDGHSVARTEVHVQARHLGTDSMALNLALAGDSLRLMGTFSDSVMAELAMSGDGGSIRGQAWADSVSSLTTALEFSRNEASTEWRLTNLRFRSGVGEWQLAETAVLQLFSNSANVRGFRLVGRPGGEIAAAGNLAWYSVDRPEVENALVQFDVRLRDVPVGLIPQAFRPEGEVRGILSGDLRLEGTAGAPAIAGNIDARDVMYERAGLERLRADLSYRDHRLDLRALAYLEGREVLSARGRIPVDLRLGPIEDRLLNQPLDSFRVTMDSFPAAFVLGIARAGFSNIEGVLDGAIDAIGTPREPRLSGALVLRGAAATWDVTGVRYTGVNGLFDMNQELRTNVDINAFTAGLDGRNGGGSLRITGVVDLAQPTDPDFDLQIDFANALAARRRDMDVTASGRINIDGRYTQPLITGDVAIVNSTMYLDELYRQTQIIQFEDPLLFELVDTTIFAQSRVRPEAENPFLANIRLDRVGITVGPNSWIRGREMNVELAGELTVIYNRPVDLIIITGTLNAVRGTYILEYPPITRVFEVQEGSITFPGTPGIDPVLNITALYTTRTARQPLNIYADVQGTLTAPSVHLRSDVNPPISESDLASYLFLNAPTFAFGGAASSGVGGVLGGLGSGALRASGLGWVASGLQTLGQSMGLVDYVGLTAAEASPVTGQQLGLTDLFAGTQIELGRYITPRLFVIYTQPVNSVSNTPGVRLEWRFNQLYTAEIFTEDRFARTPAFRYSEAVARRVYGLLIARTWNY